MQLAGAPVITQVRPHDQSRELHARLSNMCFDHAYAVRQRATQGDQIQGLDLFIPSDLSLSWVVHDSPSPRAPLSALAISLSVAAVHKQESSSAALARHSLSLHPFVSCYQLQLSLQLLLCKRFCAGCWSIYTHSVTAYTSHDHNSHSLSISYSQDVLIPALG